MDTLAWLITAAWGASFVLDTIIERYDPPAAIHGLMTIVAAAAIGSGLVKPKEDKD